MKRKIMIVITDELGEFVDIDLPDGICMKDGENIYEMEDELKRFLQRFTTFSIDNCTCNIGEYNPEDIEEFERMSKEAEEEALRESKENKEHE